MRARTRDEESCLITGGPQAFSRLSVAHIFSRVHDIEVIELFLV